MAVITLQDRFAATLLANGSTEVPSRSGRVRTFTKGNEGSFYFLGKGGSVRVGPSLTRSIPASEAFKNLLLARCPIGAKRASKAPKPDFVL